jgi:hypothetical protein
MVEIDKGIFRPEAFAKFFMTTSPADSNTTIRSKNGCSRSRTLLPFLRTLLRKGLPRNSQSVPVVGG